MENIDQPSQIESKKNPDLNVFDFSYIWAASKHFWKLIIICTIASMGIAIILSVTIPKKWEASATLQIGHNPIVSRNSQTETNLIEDPSQTVQRINLREFKDKILIKMGWSILEQVDSRSNLLRSSLQGSIIKDTEFVNIIARAYNPDDATKIITAAITEIQLEHRLITDPIRIRTVKELDIINTKLNAANSVLKDINSAMVQPHITFESNIVAINLLATKQAEVNMLQEQFEQKKTLLDVLDRQNTRIINKVYVGNHAVFPKKGVFLVIGILAGLFIGLCIALFRFEEINLKSE